MREMLQFSCNLAAIYPGLGLYFKDNGKGRRVSRPCFAGDHGLNGYRWDLDGILMPNQQPTRSGAPSVATIIPDKLYFRIGEVAELCGVAAYVLRFWETEFPQLRPHKSGTGQRLYRRRDVEMAIRIKRLLYEDGYTIPGARQSLKSEIKAGAAQPELPFKPEVTEPPAASRTQTAQLQSVRAELARILEMLSSGIR